MLATVLWILGIAFLVFVVVVLRFMLRGPTVGFFVFDYSVMNSSYGHEAFAAIRDALASHRGTCAFCDGDVSSETVRKQARQTMKLVPANSDSPLANLDTPFEFGAYLAAMWADSSSAFDRIHSHLCSVKATGYLGYLTLGREPDRSRFLQEIQAKMYLGKGLVFVNGRVDPTSAKHGIS